MRIYGDIRLYTLVYAYMNVNYRIWPNMTVYDRIWPYITVCTFSYIFSYIFSYTFSYMTVYFFVYCCILFRILPYTFSQKTKYLLYNKTLSYHINKVLFHLFKIKVSLCLLCFNVFSKKIQQKSFLVNIFLLIR